MVTKKELGLAGITLAAGLFFAERMGWLNYGNLRASDQENAVQLHLNTYGTQRSPYMRPAFGVLINQDGFEGDQSNDIGSIVRNAEVGDDYLAVMPEEPFNENIESYGLGDYSTALNYLALLGYADAGFGGKSGKPNLRYSSDNTTTVTYEDGKINIELRAPLDADSSDAEKYDHNIETLYGLLYEWGRVAHPGHEDLLRGNTALDKEKIMEIEDVGGYTTVLYLAPLLMKVAPDIGNALVDISESKSEELESNSPVVYNAISDALEAMNHVQEGKRNIGDIVIMAYRSSSIPDFNRRMDQFKERNGLEKLAANYKTSNEPQTAYQSSGQFVSLVD